MRVTVIGCSGSFPGPLGPASCYLVQADGFALLLDFGSGAVGTLQRYHDPYRIDAVAISHLHTDHWIDLCAYRVARKYHPAGPRPKIPVYGPQDTARRAALAYDLAPDPGMGDTFDFHVIRAGTYEIGPFRVRTVRTNHPVETYAYRVEHGGGALVYSADTGPSEALVELARDADLFLCEASMVHDDGATDDLHLSGRGAVEHAARAGARRLVLTHLVPWYDPADVLDEAKAAAKSAGFAGDVQLAKVGACYPVGEPAAPDRAGCPE